MTKFYLITGGSGFIGSSLAIALVNSGHRVRVLDNQSRGSLRRLMPIAGQYEFIEGDIRNADLVAKAIKGTDAVCHLAFVNGTEFFYEKPELVLDVAVKGMINIVDACIEHNVPELVLASSSEVYHNAAHIPTAEDVPLVIPDVFNPRYSYSAGKIISEVMAINYGRKHFQRVMIFRPHNVYGPDMGFEHVIPQFVSRIRAMELPASGPVQFPIQDSGKQTRAFIFIDDFVRGLMLMFEHGQHLQIYHIGSEDEVTIEHVAQLIGNYFGYDIKIIAGQPAKGAPIRRCPDTTKIRQLGFRPQVSLKEGIALTASWYDKNQHLQLVGDVH